MFNNSFGYPLLISISDGNESSWIESSFSMQRPDLYRKLVHMKLQLLNNLGLTILLYIYTIIHEENLINILSLSLLGCGFVKMKKTFRSILSMHPIKCIFVLMDYINSS